MPEIEAWRQRLLRGIPATNLILATPRARQMIDRFSHPLFSEAVGESLADLRQRVLRAADEDDLPDIDWTPDGLAEWAAWHLESKLRPHLRRVVNATGVVLHTNLGRALLPRAAVEQVAAAASWYSNLELDLATGERGDRQAHVEEVLRALTGAEAAMAVNNNAGAVLLALSAIARGREVIVSRGELVEIGGAFRVPEVMEQSGAHLREVGTTNKTRLADYERAIGPETGALLKVHTSNFRVVGFTAAVELEELSDLGRRRGLPVLYDQGSGVLVRLERFGLQPEQPTVRDSVRAGADLVTFSGDKLLGGPQAGMVVGRRELVERCRRHPLARALRIDKLTLAALEATLRIYLDEPRALREVPTLRMLLAPPDEIEQRARGLAGLLSREVGDLAAISVVDGHSQAGGGSLPGQQIPTRLVAVASRTRPTQEVESRLRQADPPVMVRVQKEQLLLDPRTLQEGEDILIAAALRAALT